MKLPIPTFGKQQKQKYILALLLRDEKISAIITEEVDGKMKVVGQQEEILTTPLEKIPYEEWLDILDRTISKAEETLPPDRETHDTVFGVKESWVEDKKIKKEYLLELKKASEALDLTPIGFLVISEAVSHLIQAEEGAPVSAILVDIGKAAVTATLVRGSKIIESKSIKREESLPADVDAALKHFSSADVFPSRVILFLGSSPAGDMENIEHLAQKFISHHWSKSLPFLHAPQISVLGGGFDAKAVVQGAATQMGFEVLNLTESKDEEIKNFDIVETHAGKKKHDEEEEAELETDDFEKALSKKEVKSSNKEEAEIIKKDKDPEPDDAFGFLLDEDVSDKPKVHHDNFEPIKTLHHEKKPHEDQELPDVKMHQEEIGYEEDKETSPESNASPAQKVMAMVSGFTQNLKIPSAPLQSISSLPVLNGPGKKLVIIPVAVLLLLGILYFAYLSTVKATVTIYLKPNNVSESADILFSTEKGNNFSENSIAAETTDTELEGTVSTDTTGKKAVGDKAKGNVTIYNNDSSRKTIPLGTTITTDKGLKFVTDKEIVIASASGDIFSGTKPGTGQVAVNAAEVGTDYNLPSNTKFNVTGVSNVAAKNESAFSGGTKRDVTVVAKKDQDKLLVELSKSLEEKALSELNGSASGDKKLLEFLTQASVTKKTFDKKIDDEAKKVTLKGTVSFEALSYSQKDLTDFATVVLKNEYDDNLNLSEKGINVEIENEKQRDDGEVSATLKIEAGLIPKIDTTSVIRQIEGKSLSDADATLKKLPQVAEIKIDMSPSIPLLPVFLPGTEDRITLKTALHE